MNAIDMITAERERQISAEGWTPEHDDIETEEELARAAACYATPSVDRSFLLWPWSDESWKPTPKDRIRELVKSGALIVAEIERLQRIDSANAKGYYKIATSPQK